jgi:DNA end-binding protein Ku
VRPYWKGYLKLALVSCPIALHAACSTAERIAFRQINKATGNRLRQQLIDEETREPVAPEHKGRKISRKPLLGRCDVSSNEVTVRSMRS